MEEREIGKISHYFSKISVGIIELTDVLKVGDTIHVRGAHDDFTQKIDSMQIEHLQVEQAKAGDSVGVKVTGKIHENDRVYKVIG